MQKTQSLSLWKAAETTFRGKLKKTQYTETKLLIKSTSSNYRKANAAYLDILAWRKKKLKRKKLQAYFFEFEALHKAEQK